MTIPTTSYDAVVLAGGRSRRMGTDKAHLPHPITKGPLLGHQFALLAKLSPAPTKWFVSARSGQALPAFPAQVKRLDDDGESGPLGGIAKALGATVAAHVLVIATDLPFLEKSLVEALLSIRVPGSGCCYKIADQAEPLVGLFPREFLATASVKLSHRDLSVRRTITEWSNSGRWRLLDAGRSAHAFKNWNSPGDI